MSNEANGTVSKLNLTPAIEDDGRIVTCRAQTPLLAGGFVEDEWRMQVYCKYSRAIASQWRYANDNKTDDMNGNSALRTLHSFLFEELRMKCWFSLATVRGE